MRDMENRDILTNVELNDPDDYPDFNKSLLEEAKRVVREIKFGVEEAGVSTTLESSDSIAYINIRTLEKECWCVELTCGGYKIVSDAFDTISEDQKFKNDILNRFETYEALMHQISQMFVRKFNDSVAERLKQIS